ncbi:hypothetical protein QEN19_001791 [Hanseniaspora menglaensis]
MSGLPKRIIKETKNLILDPVPGMKTDIPDEDNLRYLSVEMEGPGNSPYQGGVFNLELYLPEDYPMEPPKIRFLTPVYHPNIDKLGRICLDVLKDHWSPAFQIRTVLLSIQQLLDTPNPDDPLLSDVAELCKSNNAEYCKIAKEWTLKYAVTKKEV